MSRADRKASGRGPLADLLVGLRLRGMTVGPDDAARVVAVFRHAAGWSHARRVRALKALLGRNDDERRLIDQLSPFLFVEAHRREEGQADDGGGAAMGEAEGALASRAGTRTTGAQVGDRSDGSSGSRRAPWSLIVLGCALAVAVAVLALEIPWSRPWPPASGDGGVVDLAPLEDLFRPADDGGLPDLLDGGAPAIAEGGSGPPPLPVCQTALPLPPRRWPFLLFGGTGVLPVIALALRRRRFARQQRNIDALARSEGPRTWRLEIPAEQAPDPLDATAVREAAFQLTAPSADVVAPWLDPTGTVQATARRAGQLVLRFASQREHRPLLFVEDVGVSMARWPDHGRQIVEAIRRQGGEVIHCFFDGAPALTARQRDLAGRLSLEQLLADEGAPVVVLLGDAAGLERSAVDSATWTAALGNALWLHPRPAELWGPGARAVAACLQVVPVSEEGLRRLGTPRPDGLGDLPRRWTAPRPAGSDPLSCLEAWRGAVGDDAFFWLAAGAVLDRIGGLTARAWWALRSNGIAPAPWHLVERVWELRGLRVASDGTVALPGNLREALIEALGRERPDLRAQVVAWAKSLIAVDLGRLPADSPARVAARAGQARLALVDPAQRGEARRLAQALANDGYGNLLAGAASDEERGEWQVDLRRAAGLRRWQIGVAALGAVAILAALPFLANPTLWTRIVPPKPDFQVLSSSRVWNGSAIYPVSPDAALVFCDRRQLARKVYARAGNDVVLLDAAGDPAVWTLPADSPLFPGVSVAQYADLYLGYEQRPTGGPWKLNVFDVGVAVLRASATPRDAAPGVPPGTFVALTWEVPARNLLEKARKPPPKWDILRDGKQIGRNIIDGTLFWVDAPQGAGPWRYQVTAVAAEGRPYRSNEVLVNAPLVPIPVDRNVGWLLQPALEKRRGYVLTLDGAEERRKRIELLPGNHAFGWSRPDVTCRRPWRDEVVIERGKESKLQVPTDEYFLAACQPVRAGDCPGGKVRCGDLCVSSDNPLHAGGCFKVVPEVSKAAAMTDPLEIGLPGDGVGGALYRLYYSWDTNRSHVTTHAIERKVRGSSAGGPPLDLAGPEAAAAVERGWSDAGRRSFITHLALGCNSDGRLLTSGQKLTCRKGAAPQIETWNGGNVPGEVQAGSVGRRWTAYCASLAPRDVAAEIVAARRLMRSLQFDEALYHLKAATRLDPDPRSAQEAIGLMIDIGGARVEGGQFAEAAVAYQIAEGTIRQQYDRKNSTPEMRRMQTTALFALGNLYQKLGQIPEARVAFLQAAEGYRLLRAPTESAVALTLLAELDDRAGEAGNASQHRNDAIALYKSLGNRSEIERLQALNARQGPAPCAGGETRCGDFCVHLDRDPFHYKECFTIAPSLTEKSARGYNPPPWFEFEFDGVRRRRFEQAAYYQLRYRWSNDRLRIEVGDYGNRRLFAESLEYGQLRARIHGMGKLRTFTDYAIFCLPGGGVADDHATRYRHVYRETARGATWMTDGDWQPRQTKELGDAARDAWPTESLVKEWTTKCKREASAKP
ncbi:MAG: tetratricopeptide repeat protein [Myxococcales bacterium]|nr:tetratricopeptide repeat protein [Myxococcales bacterium]